MADRIVCDILTGFLGSGKSTLLNAFLRQQAKGDIAVIVNEFGNIGIDQLSLQEVSSDIYLLDSGCLCCSITNSLSETLLEINSFQAQSRCFPLRRVVIETSGLADPAPILNVLLGDRTLKDYFKLGQVITTVDAMQGAKQLHDHREALRQVAVAEKLVMTKVDQVGLECRSELWRILKNINPNGTVTESSNGDAAAEIFLEGPLSSDLGLGGLEPKAVFRTPTLETSLLQASRDRPLPHHGTIRSWGGYYEETATWAGVSAWWNLLVHKYGDSLLRCKGLLQIADPHQFVLIQGVGKVFHSPQVLKQWPDCDLRSRIVCIGVGLNDDWLFQSLRAMKINNSSCRPLTLEELDECL